MLKQYFFILIALSAIGFFAQPVQAQATITTNEATVDFPQTVTFDLAYEGDVQAAKLVYDVEKFSCVEVAASVPVEIETAGKLSWTWVMQRSGNPPPGSQLWWQWELTLPDGSTMTTPRQSTILQDTRFEWRTVSAERITLHWYEGDDVGDILLAAAVEGLDRLENDMGVRLQDDVEIYIYGNSRAMREAIIYIQDWAGGVAFSEYNTILIGVEPNEAVGWGTSTVAHELGHLVLGQAGRSCVGGARPTWLEEGLAQIAEGEPSETIRNDIADGIDNNSFAPIRSLNGAFPAHGSDARAAYSQSYSIANYLLTEYGSDQLAELIALLAAGESYDDALEQLYGFNLDGLEVAWRQSIAAPEREILPTLTPVSAELVPTIAPVAAAQSVATPANIPITTPPPQTETSAPGGGICGLPFFVVALVGFGGIKRRSPKKRD